MTAVAGAIFTAAQFNQFVRDNLNQTGPALVGSAGQILVSTAANALAARTPTTATVATSESTSSTGYTNLTTPGPAVTVTTGTNALIWVYSLGSNSGGASAYSNHAFSISGATTFAATDSYGIGGAFGATGARIGAFWHFTGLTAGSNTFTSLYRVGSGTGSFADRKIGVIPL